MQAVIRTGGKQYRVAPGQQLRVDRLAGDAGDTVDLTDVLLLSDEDSTTLGTPTVENAHVVASIVEQVRGRKILVFKYKSKKRYRKLRGHRQRHTDLRIEEIVGPDGASYKHEKREHIVEEEPPTEAEDAEDEAAVDEAKSEEVAVDEIDVDEAAADEAADETTEDATAVDEVEDDASKDEAPADEGDEAADDSEAKQDEED